MVSACWLRCRFSFITKLRMKLVEVCRFLRRVGLTTPAFSISRRCASSLTRRELCCGTIRPYQTAITVRKAEMPAMYMTTSSGVTPFGKIIDELVHTSNLTILAIVPMPRA